ncbi:SDR family NAD(P)-dependent oxidoreductase [Streptomyces sp. NPDC058891]|uniref:SDR family NAD(P)-dependent oxidoreductase n=1 Tax=Streptomyces sp. NPDC058891 TaxID=3346667 RepID=UPI0036836327
MNASTKIALITGGSRGIGLDTAYALADQGVDIALTYRSGHKEAAAAVKELHSRGRRAHALHLDVEKSATFADFTSTLSNALAQGWGREQFDFLVNNAGSVRMGAFTELAEDDFDTMMNLHVKGPFFLIQNLLPLISDGGSIINVSTGLTRFTQPGMSAYVTAKGGVETLTRYLAKELGERGIKVNAVAPGATATDFAGGFARSDHAARAIGGMTTLGRVGRPDDIGRVIAALLTTADGWITGQRIEASGGMLL